MERSPAPEISLTPTSDTKKVKRQDTASSQRSSRHVRSASEVPQPNPFRSNTLNTPGREARADSAAPVPLPKTKSTFSTKNLFKKKKKTKEDKESTFDEVVVDIVRDAGTINDGPCGHCGERVSATEGGLQFGIKIYHDNHLYCRVCNRLVAAYFAKSQDRSHNAPICEDCA